MQGLVGVGLRAALVQCGELRSCGLPMQGPQWVLLAPHLLAYYLNQDDTPAVLTRRDLVPDNTGACSMQWRDMQSIRAGRPAGWPLRLAWPIEPCLAEPLPLTRFMARPSAPPPVPVRSAVQLRARAAA